MGDRARRCREYLCAVTVAPSSAAVEVGRSYCSPSSGQWTFRGAPSPTRTGRHPRPPVFRVYYFYIILGSVLILHAIIYWQKTCTRRIERAECSSPRQRQGHFWYSYFVDRTAGKYTEYINVHIDLLSIIRHRLSHKCTDTFSSATQKQWCCGRK